MGSFYPKHVDRRSIFTLWFAFWHGLFIEDYAQQVFMAGPIVLKFGGTSVATPSALNSLRTVVTTHHEVPVLVVVSALAGMTDRLLVLLSRKKIEACDISDIEATHLDLARRVLDEETHRRYAEEAAEILSVLRHTHMKPAELGLEVWQDQVLSLGERLSSKLVEHYLRLAGSEVVSVEATRLLKTDRRFGSASLCYEETSASLAEAMSPHLQHGRVVITQGFIGSTQHGEVTTLGRGGADFSATLFGALLGAREIQIWTDADGVMSVDPQLVDEAQTLLELGIAQARDLSLFGAHVLHPACLEPLSGTSIPLRVRNIFAPEKPGTLIHTDKTRVGSVFAVCGLTNVPALQKNLATRNDLSQPRSLVGKETFDSLFIQNVPRPDPESSLVYVMFTGGLGPWEFFSMCERALEEIGNETRILSIRTHSGGILISVPLARWQASIRQLHHIFGRALTKTTRDGSVEDQILL